MKSILVIDVPDDFETKTAIAIVDVKNERGEGVTAMCPLKPMPEKNTWDITKNGHVTEYAEGWNACLEELEE